MTKTTKHYHHGDLRQALINQAKALIAENGIEQLSLRKLAERCGVSRMAPYHHFKDKHELLCAIATDGFLALEALLEQLDLSPQAPKHDELGRFVLAYLHFARHEPERYDLMFGRQIWKLSHPTDELREVAFRTFKLYASTLMTLFNPTQLPPGSKPLRLAQASWATLHGLCRLLIDGIYLHQGDMEEVAAEAINLLARQFSAD